MWFTCSSTPGANVNEQASEFAVQEEGLQAVASTQKMLTTNSAGKLDLSDTQQP
jgi:hypothetical protein